MDFIDPKLRNYYKSENHQHTPPPLQCPRPRPKKKKKIINAIFECLTEDEAAHCERHRRKKKKKQL